MPQGSKGKGPDAEGFDRIRPRPEAASPASPASGAGSDDPAVDEVGAEVLDVEEQAAEVVEADLAVLLETALRERDEYLDLSRRVQADFENYKKRMIREQTNLLERASERLVSSLLPVVDAFDLAQAHMAEGAEFSPEGKALVQAASLLADTLTKEGLQRIEAVGEAFDPNVHEAVEHLPADAGDPAGDGLDGPVVVEALRAGYRWKDRVLRPAMVRVRG